MRLHVTHPLLGTWPTTQAHALTVNQTGDPLVHKLALNPLSHTIQSLSLVVFELQKKSFPKFLESLASEATAFRQPSLSSTSQVLAYLLKNKVLCGFFPRGREVG